MSELNNTDLQIKFNKETEKQVLQTGVNMNLYYTDEYVKWLESIVLRQANGVEQSTESASHIQNVSFNEAEYCTKCGKSKRMKGDGTLELLCECSEVEVCQCAIPNTTMENVNWCIKCNKPINWQT